MSILFVYWQFEGFLAYTRGLRDETLKLIHLRKSNFDLKHISLGIMSRQENMIYD